MTALHTVLRQHLTSLGPVGSYGLSLHQGDEALPVLYEAQPGYSFLLEDKSPQSELIFQSTLGHFLNNPAPYLTLNMEISVS